MNRSTGTADFVTLQAGKNYDKLAEEVKKANMDLLFMERISKPLSLSVCLLLLYIFVFCVIIVHF